MKFGGIFVALLFSLAACSSDPEPREPQATSSPAPTSTATAPAMPAQASEDSPEGAAEFVIYWVDVFNYAAQTGDVVPLRDLSSKDCSGCTSYANALADDPDTGSRPTSDIWKLKKVDSGSSRDPLVVTADALVREGSGSKNYQFAFELSGSAPFTVSDLTIVEAE